MVEKGAIGELRVLVVDDDPFMLEVITETLGGIGVEEVKTASSGREALGVLAEGAEVVDLLVCDLNMPGMDGIEFLRHLAERRFVGNVALISGEDSRILETAGALAGAHHLNILGAFAKPLSRDVLAGIIKQVGETRTESTRKPSQPITEAELRRGIAGDELTVYFQPKVSIATGELVGVESLVRWRHPTRGMVAPDAFIPVAETFGLIDDLTDAVFVKSMQQGGAWLSEGLDVKVAVNISVDSLERLDLPEFVVATAAEHGMDPSHVMLEVTESRLMADTKKPLEILTRLRLKGIGLSIDDFGTGHSSLAQLKRIPFTELKVDRFFVTGAVHDDAARAILESSVGLAKKLNMTIVAEGVETQEDWDLVARMACDLVQGYFVAKPMPGPDIVPWHETYRAQTA